jgi:hypothetical protein
MADQTIKTVLDSRSDRRVRIVQRDDGLFSFVEERLTQPDVGDPCWIPASRSLALCDTAAHAEREAADRIAWFKQTSAN